MGSAIDKRKSMCLILHCADISNPAKPYHIHCKWTEMLLEEFFRQGDDEIKIGLPASPMMDRNTTLIPESQIGFMNVIVQPAFTVLHDMFDLVTTQILLEFKKHGSRRASACVLPASNNVSIENNSNHKLGKQKIIDITNGENGENINNNNKINSISKNKMDDKSKTNNNMNIISENTENSNNTEARDDLTKLQDRKTSNKTENNSSSSNSNKPKLRSTPSWVESQKNKDSLGLHYNSNTPDDDETMMDRIQIVRVEEIMDRLKVFRENVTSIIEDNKSRWQEQKDRDEQIMNAAQS